MHFLERVFADLSLVVISRLIMPYLSYRQMALVSSKWLLSLAMKLSRISNSKSYIAKNCISSLHLVSQYHISRESLSLSLSLSLSFKGESCRENDGTRSEQKIAWSHCRTYFKYISTPRTTRPNEPALSSSTQYCPS